ncbi:hypothetical protein J1N35_010454 [Gossypium stocksii]|uniref:Uncharacterized protein n=1 Tax=Gossypium stocksii TaxID=47602 RepID=A0A9D3W018_9ROSI|nr:hypothetical protein J1N35_010454 [Gossypium stocksii]
MLSEVEEWMVKIEEYMVDMKELVNAVDAQTTERMENYFRAKGIMENVVKIKVVGQIGSEIMRCLRAVKMSKAITVVKSMVKLSLKKEKLESSKSEEKGLYERNHKKDNNSCSNGNYCGNGKPQLGKKKPNKKRGKLKWFLCTSLHLLKKYLKKFVLSEKENMDDVLDKKPKKLGLSKRKVETKRVKTSKRKRVKYFLRRGPHELRNYPKQAMVKEKATSELVESLEGLPPKKNLGLMRLNSGDTSEELPPMGEVYCVSNFEKVMNAVRKNVGKRESWLLAIEMYQRVGQFELKDDKNLGKSFEERKKLRRH